MQVNKINKHLFSIVLLFIFKNCQSFFVRSRDQSLFSFQMDEIFECGFYVSVLMKVLTIKMKLLTETKTTIVSLARLD